MWSRLIDAEPKGPQMGGNPQKFMNIPQAKAADFVKATERVYHGSRLRVNSIEEPN